MNEWNEYIGEIKRRTSEFMESRISTDNGINEINEINE